MGSRSRNARALSASTSPAVAGQQAGTASPAPVRFAWVALEKLSGCHPEAAPFEALLNNFTPPFHRLWSFGPHSDVDPSLYSPVILVRSRRRLQIIGGFRTHALATARGSTHVHAAVMDTLTSVQIRAIAADAARVFFMLAVFDRSVDAMARLQAFQAEVDALLAKGTPSAARRKGETFNRFAVLMGQNRPRLRRAGSKVKSA